ncbi:MAG: YqgE/AlgH family protein [Candidatus Sulfotelmatobacter sp.]
MSLGNLCLFTVLAGVVAFPLANRSEIGQPETRALNSPNIEVLSTALLPVQTKNPEDLGRGKVLVASRGLGDPNFAETVILLVHYDTQGVIGMMLNRRTEVPISRVLKEMKGAKDISDPVYLGGPVEIPGVFALLRTKEKVDGAEQVFGGVYWISAKAALEKAISSRPEPGGFHVYLGYAGWTPEQLRAEVRLGAWFIFQADDQTVFNANPGSLWREMIKRTEMQMTARPPAQNAGRPG